MSDGRPDRGRHRLRYLAKEGRYVCSARGCTYTDPNLTLAMQHVHANNTKPREKAA